MQQRNWTVHAASLAVIGLSLTGCGGSEAEITHPIDAAEAMLDALGSEDATRMCELVADPQSGPVAESLLPQCEVWAETLISSLGERQLETVQDSRIATVTLADGQRAQVLTDDYEQAPSQIPVIDLIEVNDQWFVENVSFP